MNDEDRKTRIRELLTCRCEDKYSIEPHGNGYALYFGRCRHRHGANLLQITGTRRKDLLELIEDSLNEKHGRT